MQDTGDDQDYIPAVPPAPYIALADLTQDSHEQVANAQPGHGITDIVNDYNEYADNEDEDDVDYNDNVNEDDDDDYDVEDDEDDEDEDDDDEGDGDGMQELAEEIRRRRGYLFEQAVALSLPEVTAAVVASGAVDMQGIGWGELGTTRDLMRLERLANYDTFRNLRDDLGPLSKDMTPMRQDNSIYKFRYMRQDSRSVIVHFQLRHLLASTSKNDLYYSAVAGPEQCCVRHWSPMTRTRRDVLNLKQLGLGHIQVSTLAALDDLVMAGGFSGEFVVRRVSCTDGLGVHSGIITAEPNGITNHLQMRESRSGAKVAIVSSNDECVRVMNLERLATQSYFRQPWAVNCTASSPDGRILCVVGDDKEALIASTDTGEPVLRLTGHLDYSFSCAWSSCGRWIATGNQDMTTRIYDIRRCDKALWVLGGKMGAIRSLQFSENSRILAMAEPADFVHVVDMASLSATDGSGGSEGAAKRHASVQLLDFFGEISGVAMAGPRGEDLFVANADARIGGIMEFQQTSDLERLWGVAQQPSAAGTVRAAHDAAHMPPGFINI